VREAAPGGYGPAALGVPVFVLSGLGGGLRHGLLGVEVGLEALLSPTHLLLALGAVLMVAGPFRAAWRRTARPRPGGALTRPPLPGVRALAPHILHVLR